MKYFILLWDFWSAPFLSIHSLVKQIKTDYFDTHAHHIVHIFNCLDFGHWFDELFFCAICMPENWNDKKKNDRECCDRESNLFSVVFHVCSCSSALNPYKLDTITENSNWFNCPFHSLIEFFFCFASLFVTTVDLIWITVPKTKKKIGFGPQATGMTATLEQIKTGLFGHSHRFFSWNDYWGFLGSCLSHARCFSKMI